MKEFKKDIFSTKDVKISNTSVIESNLIIGILSSYSLNTRSSLQSCTPKVFRFGELGLNSSNYLVSNYCDGKSYVVKCMDNAMKEFHNNNIKFASQLESELAYLPTFHKINLNDYVLDRGDHGYSVSDYRQGDYFQGNVSQLICVAQAVKNMRRIACQSTIIQARQSEKYNLDKNIKSIMALFDRIDEKVFLDFNQKTYLKKRKAQYENVCEILSSLTISKLELESVHSDLHPHNILFSGSQLTGIIDVDSFKSCNPNVAYGFAAYKLYRQALSRERAIEYKYTIDQFIRDFNVDFSPKEMLVAALAEISRRCAYILDPLLNGKESKWASVLEIQMLGLIEVLYLIKRLDK